MKEERLGYRSGENSYPQLNVRAESNCIRMSVDCIVPNVIALCQHNIVPKVVHWYHKWISIIIYQFSFWLIEDSREKPDPCEIIGLDFVMAPTRQLELALKSVARSRVCQTFTCDWHASNIRFWNRYPKWYPTIISRKYPVISNIHTCIRYPYCYPLMLSNFIQSWSISNKDIPYDIQIW